MDQVMKLNNQSSGRDKLFRLIQYGSKLIWASLENKSQNRNLISKLKELEYALSTGRKLYRFGRGVDTFYGALSSLHLSDPTLRYTITLSKINNAFYLLSDHVIWLGRVGLLDVDKNKWSSLSYKFWLYFLVMNLCRDFYEIRQALNKSNFVGLNQEIQSKKSRPPNTVVAKLSLLYRMLYLHKHVVVDTIKNGCDICLPLSQLGYLSISPRSVGILGMISSAAGMLPLLNASYKLAP